MTEARKLAYPRGHAEDPRGAYQRHGPLVSPAAQEFGVAYSAGGHMRPFWTFQLPLAAAGAIILASSGGGKSGIAILHDGAVGAGVPASMGGILGGSWLGSARARSWRRCGFAISRIPVP